MNQPIHNKTVFVAKSLLWSLLLYGVLMLALNWEDVATKLKGNNVGPIVNNNLPLPETPGVEAPQIIPVKILNQQGIIQSLAGMLSILAGK